MAMSGPELRALLATMDAVLALGEIARVQGNVEQVNDLLKKFEHLEEIRKLAKKTGLGRETNE